MARFGFLLVASWALWRKGRGRTRTYLIVLFLSPDLISNFLVPWPSQHRILSSQRQLKEKGLHDKHEEQTMTGLSLYDRREEETMTSNSIFDKQEQETMTSKSLANMREEQTMTSMSLGTDQEQVLLNTTSLLSMLMSISG